MHITVSKRYYSFKSEGVSEDQMMSLADGVCYAGKQASTNEIVEKAPV